MAVMRLIGTAFYAPDAPKLPAPDQASELLVTLTEWVDRLRGPIEAQSIRNSAITVDGIANVEIAGSETADAAVDDDNGAAGLEQNRATTKTEPGDIVSKAKELSETPKPEEHDDVGQQGSEVIETQPRRNGGDEDTVSAGGREQESTNEIDVAQSADSQQARVDASYSQKLVTA
jgi:hypothetical protein